MESAETNAPVAPQEMLNTGNRAGIEALVRDAASLRRA
jgi:hypothetical protein